VATWHDVRQIALALPDVAEGTSWGAPALRVRGKWFAGISPHAEAAGALVLRCDPDERPLLLSSRPEVFYVTPHYEGSYAYVLVRLDAVDRAELAERLEDAWLAAAPKRLAAARVHGRERP